MVLKQLNSHMETNESLPLAHKLEGDNSLIKAKSIT